MSQEKRSRNPLITIKCLLILLFVGGLISLQSFNHYAQHAPSGEKVNLAAGEKLFSGACSNAYCHGGGGAGGGAPALVNRDFTPEYLTRVIANGIPGTNMPGFKNRFKDEQIAQLTNYVLSLSPGRAKTSNASAATDNTGANSAAAVRTPAPIAKSSAVLAEEEAGRALFFGSIQGCHTCHSYNNKGGKAGPDLLARVSGKSIKEITDLITAPRGGAGESFALLSVTTNDGRRISGIKRDENPETIRIYDASSLPPVSRVIAKSDITKTDQLDLAAVHKPFVAKYSAKELQQLAAYLKSADGAATTAAPQK